VSGITKSANNGPALRVEYSLDGQAGIGIDVSIQATPNEVGVLEVDPARWDSVSRYPFS
jgi:hypothetical protein